MTMSGTVQLLTSRISVRHGCLLSARRSPALRWLSSGHRMSRGLKESYRLLQLPEEGSSTPAQVRQAYLRLAKLYHPDSGTATADGVLFAQVEEAYRAVLTHQSKIGHKEAEEEEEDEGKSRGAALQHRHYLSFDGVGSGTPSQRERQYRQVRVDRAAEQVLSYRQREHERGAAGDGALVERDTRQRSRKIKITQAVERLVEDLIQESMARGDFRNLSGAGKPLTAVGRHAARHPRGRRSDPGPPAGGEGPARRADDRRRAAAVGGAVCVCAGGAAAAQQAGGQLQPHRPHAQHADGPLQPDPGGGAGRQRGAAAPAGGGGGATEEEGGEEKSQCSDEEQNQQKTRTPVMDEGLDFPLKPRFCSGSGSAQTYRMTRQTSNCRLKL
ncbi:dnaJ homolog subfamily C member 28 isoform X3 [Oryzias latipes]|uniref:dnaJ homolog subfamily C member 28 isoform X3 n=1 Tax=Oryzias latipes TaxID=8090 RepID=UPI000CE230E9|nr:dnaJ homolog subfamily C member 28 isoform X3 [Oryzias latipes]